MNQNMNLVTLPKGATHKGKAILKVLSAVIGEKDSESGYMIVNEDGDREFMKTSEVAKLSEKPAAKAAEGSKE